jgi:hypothetical protein
MSGRELPVVQTSKMRLKKGKLVCAIIIFATIVICGGWIVGKLKPQLHILQDCRSKTEGMVCFTLTNPTPISYHYWVLNEFKTNKIWNIYPPVQDMHSKDKKILAPHQAVTISVNPPNRSREWRITAFCVRSPSAPPTFTARVGNFLDQWNLRPVATELELYDKGILVPGPEMPSGTLTSEGRK